RRLQARGRSVAGKGGGKLIRRAGTHTAVRAGKLRVVQRAVQGGKRGHLVGAHRSHDLSEGRLHPRGDGRRGLGKKHHGGGGIGRHARQLGSGIHAVHITGGRGRRDARKRRWQQSTYRGELHGRAAGGDHPRLVIGDS